jgi:prophage regulatory protein
MAATANHKRKRKRKPQRRNSFKKTPPIRKFVSPAAPKHIPRFAATSSGPLIAFMQGEDKVPRRLLTKPEVLARVRLTYPTIWKLMRENKFPRGRIVGNKVMWFESDVDAWVDALPSPELKGDEEEAGHAS